MLITIFKTLISLASIIGGFYIGQRLSARYVDRERYFSDLLLFCTDYKNELGFSMRRLKDILLTHMARCAHGLKSDLEAFSEALECNQDYPERALKMQLLTDSERAIVAQFFGALGRSDASTQADIIESFAVFLRQKYDECSKSRQKYGGLHTKLGVLGGLLIVVLII